MNRKDHYLTFISFIIVIILTLSWFIKDFNLSWTEVNEEYAEVTINFLVPMEQKDFEKHVKFTTQSPYNSTFDYSVTWLTKQVVSIRVKETHAIKGQSIKLYVDKAPTKWQGICKSDVVNINFKAPVDIIAPQSDLLISSTNTFQVQFSTPMNPNQIDKFVQCDSTFFIEPYRYTDEAGRTYTDLTRFIFTPKTPLENGKRYILSFKEGMPSYNGTLLGQSKSFVLQVDQKPTILKTYPANEDKWIGLYPKLTLESKEAIKKATVTIQGDTIEGTLLDEHHATFLLKDRLRPETTYEAIFQIQVASGEVSVPKNVQFTTTTLKENRMWLEVVCSDNPIIHCYQGENKIKTFSCAIGSGKESPPLGTYYLQDKQDVYEDAVHKEGANFWLRVGEDYGFQGYIRDAYWNILNTANNTLGARNKRKNIILSDEDAKWLYEQLPYQAMIIFKKQ